MVYTGAAFSASHFDRFEYDDRNELTATYRGSGTNPAATVPVSDPLHRHYAYDNIGNRSTAVDPDSRSYTSNALNQYSSIASTDYTTSATSSESFTFDDDGNLATDGTRTFTWDSENRLTSVMPTASTPQLGDTQSYFEYDYLGRRTRKTVYPAVATPGGFAWGTTPTTDIYFIYDGWNLLMAMDALNNNAILRSYTWGLDLSSSLQGAGGIGGLLSCRDASASKSYVYFADANGNIGQLLDISDGSLAAKYEYDAYGQVNASSGSASTANPFRFSMKYADDETALIYYGYRYYVPRLGRWASRDPIHPIDNLNPYSFVANAPVHRHDARGLCTAGDKCYTYDVAVVVGFNLSPDDVEKFAVLIAASTGLLAANQAKGYAGGPGIWEELTAKEIVEKFSDKTIEEAFKQIPGLGLGGGESNEFLSNFAELFEAYRKSERMSVWYRHTCKECKCPS